MHIPSSMLNGQICPVTAFMSAAGVATAAVRAFFAGKKPNAAKFAAITALIFAGQMMNFPIKDGTSGHLLGGMIAVALLGVPFATLSIALVVTIQCLVFSDGGFSVLGANIFNMAILGTAVAGMIYNFLFRKFSEKEPQRLIGLGLVSWLSIILASFGCSLELGIAGTIPFSKVIGAMISTHALIGIGEALITVALYLVLASKPVQASERRSAGVPLIASGIIAALLSPFASGFPDGLEWVAEKYQFLHESAPAFVGPLPDYTIPAISNEVLTTGLAGLIGVAITFAIAWAAAKLISRNTMVLN